MKLTPGQFITFLCYIMIRHYVTSIQLSFISHVRMSNLFQPLLIGNGEKIFHVASEAKFN